jgi:hypothetical protein
MKDLPFLSMCLPKDKVLVVPSYFLLMNDQWKRSFFSTVQNLERFEMLLFMFSFRIEMDRIRFDTTSDMPFEGKEACVAAFYPQEQILYYSMTLEGQRF